MITLTILINNYLQQKNIVFYLNIILWIIIIIIAIWIIHIIINTFNKFNKEEKAFEIITFKWNKLLHNSNIIEDGLNKQNEYQNLIEKMKDELLKKELSYISYNELNKLLERYFKNSELNKKY